MRKGKSIDLKQPCGRQPHTAGTIKLDYTSYMLSDISR